MICELGHDKTGMDILYSLCLYLFHCLLLLDLSSSALAVDSLQFRVSHFAQLSPNMFAPKICQSL